MKSLKKLANIIVAFVILAILGYGFIEFYPYIFAKTITGKVEKVERVQLNVALMQNSNTGNNANKVAPELFSFAVAIKSDDGIVHTASAEDRQWAAVREGLCVKAKFFPYPPWALDKAGTYYGARLLESRECN